MLHEETNYSKPHQGKDKNGRDAEFHYVRKPLALMTADMIEDIVDEEVKRRVKKKVSDLGGFRKGIFSEEPSHPYLRARDGRIVPIHKARIRKKIDAKLIGKSTSPRYVKTETNHHLEIIATVGDGGKDKRWEGKIIDLREAVTRVKNGQNVIPKGGHGDGKEFRFSLAKNECVEMEDETGERKLYRVVGISEGDIEFHLHTDARPTMMEGRKRVRGSPAKLFKAKARKVVIDPLGNILPAND